MTRVGIDAETMRPLVGWPHVAHCLRRILATEIGSRVERRDFGSHVANLLDRPQNEDEITRFFMVIATAIWPRRVRGRWYGEPGFGLTQLRIDASEAGRVTVHIQGVYFPNGHEGDFTVSKPADLSLLLTDQNVELLAA